MPLTSIEILGFRGFKNRGTLSFAIPNGAVGSGLTVITGPNNAGKSSVIECLKARSGYQPPSFTVGARNASVEEVEIKYVINSQVELIKSIRKGASETTKEGVDQSFQIFVLPSRRAFDPYFGRSEYSRSDYLSNTPLTAQRSSTLSNFSNRLFTTLKNQDAFNEILHEVLTFKPVWSIDQSDQGSYFLKFFNGEHSHSSDGMGEGIVSIFAIVDSLYDSKPGDVIVIDEPELSLHPGLQKRIASLLCRFAKDRQIVVSTHSPYFVDLRALSSGGQLSRIVTGKEGTVIHEISDAAKESMKALSEGNIYNPHVFGLDAKELFFQEDGIILTEGQEDVLLYPKIAEQLGVELGGSFFGWGAGGAGNIRHLCVILRDLGFKKVAALLDADQAAEATKLRTYFPDYHFDCIPAKDIRTKSARRASEEVQGLLDAQFKLKDEFIPELRALFSSLNARMTS